MDEETHKKITINLIFRFRWEKAGTLAWELKNLSFDDNSIKNFVMKFFPEYLQQHPLDKPESIMAWKDYFTEKQEKVKKIWSDIETTDEPYFVYAEKKKEELQMQKAKIFLTKEGISLDDVSMVELAEIMQKHWRGWYGGKEDILTQVAFQDLQYGLMEGTILICNNCRKLFLRPERGPEPSFCSSRCQNQYYYRKRR